MNTTTYASQFDPAMAQLADGRIVFAWADRSQNGENGGPNYSNIRMQLINLDGSKSGDELIVNEQRDRVRAEAGRHRARGWALRRLVGRPQPAGGTAGLGEHAQIFDPRETWVRLNGTPLDDDWVGTPRNDILRGAGGNDRIDGGAGVDTVEYSGTRDQYTITDLGDRFMVVGPDGTDTLLNIEYIQFDREPLKPTPPKSTPPQPPGEEPTAPSDDISGLFDTRYYLGRYADVFRLRRERDRSLRRVRLAGGTRPECVLRHRRAISRPIPTCALPASTRWSTITRSAGATGAIRRADFDTTLYLVHNPDVAAAGIDPLEHYLQHGMAEGRAIYAAVGESIAGGFDAEYYAFHNPDVAAAGVDPLVHYNAFGWHEGRNPNGWFDTAGYLAHYADVAASGANPLEHYMMFGWKEGRDPSAGFDTLGYLAENPDVAAAGVNPLEHFLKFGIYEGRAGRQ